MSASEFEPVHTDDTNLEKDEKHATGQITDGDKGRKKKAPKLVFQSLADVILDVQSRPARKWLIEGIIAEQQYGVLSKEDKGGKTWDALHMAVAVAIGGKWLGIFQALVTGNVIVFAGEGDDDEYVARFIAVCVSMGADPMDVAQKVRICFRVPTLTDEEAMAEVRAELNEYKPVLTILDPLYLAARGAKGSDLYAMGEVLAELQYAVQDAGSALLVLTHHKKGEASDPFGKITGVGPGAWGRFLIAGAVESRELDPQTGGSAVTIKLEFRGGRIADKSVRYRRRIWQDDPTDLASPLHYEMEELAVDTPATSAEAKLTPASRRMLATLRKGPGKYFDKETVGDKMTGDSTGIRPLKARTIQSSGSELYRAGFIDRRRGPKYNAWEWIALDEPVGERTDVAPDPEDEDF